MPSSSFGQEDRRPAPAPAQEPAAGESDSGRALFEEVLSLTQSSLEPADLEAHPELAAFFEVARRYPGEPLALEPMGLELVEAALSSHFRDLEMDSREWKTMVATIAGSLFDDPAAHERLIAFWERLSAKNP